MPRYVAFLRGVSPLNARMPAVKQAFEAAGFDNVRTLLSSGNVAFDGRARKTADIESKCEQALQAGLGRSLLTFVRPSLHLQALLAKQPFASSNLAPGAKPIVTFLRQPPADPPALPIEFDGARILQLVGHEVLAAYVPSPRGPAFMNLLERTFGKDITTRTLATVEKCAAA